MRLSSPSKRFAIRRQALRASFFCCAILTTRCRPPPSRPPGCSHDRRVAHASCRGGEPAQHKSGTRGPPGAGHDAGTAGPRSAAARTGLEGRSGARRRGGGPGAAGQSGDVPALIRSGAAKTRCCPGWRAAFGLVMDGKLDSEKMRPFRYLINTLNSAAYREVACISGGGGAAKPVLVALYAPLMQGSRMKKSTSRACWQPAATRLRCLIWTR